MNLKHIEEKIKKLQLIRELASDPEYAPLLQEMIASNGSRPATARTPKDLKGVRKDVYRAVAEAGDEASYRTAREIADAMKTAGYRFKSKNHKLTVKEQLRELENDGFVEKAGAREDGSALWRKK
ncbi:MAG: hypothetical protein ACRD5K_19360 [Candidatus Acidiferrales bacterium]